MKNNQKFILSVLIICMLCFAFYWLEIRPSLIIKKCSNEAESLSEVDKKFLTTLKEKGYTKEEATQALVKAKSETFTASELEEQKENRFKKCLRDNGIIE